MTTIQQIKDQLQQLQEPNEWFGELQGDQRKGVQTAIAQWKRQYEKRQHAVQEFHEKKRFDNSYRQHEWMLAAGIDEAGRGPLAGPVVTAAVILPDNCTELIGVDDSKKISKEKRLRFAELIKEHAIACSVHIQPASVIDEMNIYQATRQSMETAVKELQAVPHIVLADAMHINVPGCSAFSIIKGDEKSLAIAAASILAKTTRDALMEELHEQFPWYGFNENAGYGTAKHLEGLETHGFCEHHRKTFEPIKTMWRERQ